MPPNTSELIAASNNDRDSITIELIREEDTEDVLSLLQTYFFKDEPLNKFLKMDDCKELEEYTLSCIPEKCSFKAVNACGEVVGVFLNGYTKQPDPKADAESYSENCRNPKFKKILQLMEHVERQFNVFDVCPEVEMALEGKIMSVSEKYRGFGIAGMLADRTMEYMRDHNIRVMHVFCSSNYSARVLEKLNFEEVYSLPYSEYLQDGEQVLQPAEPHVAAKILIKRVS